MSEVSSRDGGPGVHPGHRAGMGSGLRDRDLGRGRLDHWRRDPDLQDSVFVADLMSSGDRSNRVVFVAARRMRFSVVEHAVEPIEHIDVVEARLPLQQFGHFILLAASSACDGVCPMGRARGPLLCSPDGSTPLTVSEAYLTFEEGGLPRVIHGRGTLSLCPLWRGRSWAHRWGETTGSREKTTCPTSTPSSGSTIWTPTGDRDLPRSERGDRGPQSEPTSTGPPQVGMGFGHAADDLDFFADLVAALRDMGEGLITGPGIAKVAFESTSRTDTLTSRCGSSASRRSTIRATASCWPTRGSTSSASTARLGADTPR